MAENVSLESIAGEIQNSLPIGEESDRKGNEFFNWIKKKRMKLKPWTEFVNTKTLSKPKDMGHAGRRIIKNLDTYQANYIIVCLFLSLYCIISSPMLLFAILISSAACYYISRRSGQKLTIAGREFSVAEQYGLVLTVSLPLFFFASAGSAVFWIIGASVFIVTLHASVTEPLALDDEIELNEVKAVT